MQFFNDPVFLFVILKKEDNAVFAFLYSFLCSMDLINKSRKNWGYILIPCMH